VNEKNAKLGKRVGQGSRDLILEFWDSLSILRTVEARNLEFEM